ncbi:MAG: hypothetical protein WDO13_19705 [Verrucomicrobiota bacterium]
MGLATARHLIGITSQTSIGLLEEDLPPNYGVPHAGVDLHVGDHGALHHRGHLPWCGCAGRAPPLRWEAALPILFFLYQGLKAQRHVLLLLEVALVPLARDLEVLLHATWLPFIRGRLAEFQERQRMARGDGVAGDPRRAGDHRALCAFARGADHPRWRRTLAEAGRLRARAPGAFPAAADHDVERRPAALGGAARFSREHRRPVSISTATTTSTASSTPPTAPPAGTTSWPRTTTTRCCSIPISPSTNSSSPTPSGKRFTATTTWSFTGRTEGERNDGI